MAAQPMNGREPGASHEASSEIRSIAAHEQEQRRAERRVMEYLRAYGVRDFEQLHALTASIVQGSACTSPRWPEQAVALAQARVEEFLSALWEGRAGTVDALWLRAFVEAHPECFLGEVEVARRVAREFGDLERGEPPRPRSFAPQALAPLRWPRWLRGLAPALLLTAVLASSTLAVLARDGLRALELAWALSFVPVLLLPALGSSTAWLGFRARRRAGHRSEIEAHAAAALHPEPAHELPRSVVVVPIYHESAEHVFARVAAMRESLARTPGGDSFDLFVLSDSVSPACVADEERAFRRASALASEHERVALYYRRRRLNERQKAGNLAEFFERFGDYYTYALVLDADSLMSGATMVQLARRMQAAPRVGLLQARLELHEGRSLLARGQQWLTSVCGPLFVRGLAHWAGPWGNYYGHNAIVRISAFLECCALPVLPGSPPFGGPFLSHDFVEAALLCRGGWEVRCAHDLGESWEEMPQSFPEYVARDRRWCQGNLQHLRIVFAQGLRAMSRIHLGVGILSYLAAPCWLAFMALGVLVSHGATRASTVPPWLAVCLIASAALCLTIPRALGLLDALRDARARALHGGARRLLLSAVVELLVSSMVAPLLMLHHVRAIAALCAGKSVSWGARVRDGGTSVAEIARIEAPATVLGVGTLALSFQLDPVLLPWLAPVALPWCLALPISLALSSERLGRVARALGLFLTPTELEPAELATRTHELCALTTSDESARFRDLVLDPVLLATHLARLPAARAPRDLQALDTACERAVRMGPAALTREQRMLLQSDPESMRRLHREAWRRWPIESWDLGRRAPQTPPGVAALPAQAPTNQRRTG